MAVLWLGPRHLQVCPAMRKSNRQIYWVLAMAWLCLHVFIEYDRIDLAEEGTRHKTEDQLERPHPHERQRNIEDAKMAALWAPG